MSREEYPRPQFERTEWKNLNGIWDFRLTDEEEWTHINVPFVFQSKLSHIGKKNSMCDSMQYRRVFSIPNDWNGKKIILHFGAVDYFAKVYINGKLAGAHEGGNTGFAFDITDLLTNETELLEVCVTDPCDDETILRGKQFWQKEACGIWYTRSSGIWQTVWLEPVNPVHIEKVRFTSDIDTGNVDIKLFLSEVKENLSCRISISANDKQINDIVIRPGQKEVSVVLNVFGNKILNTSTHGNGMCWSPENPVLFETSLRLFLNDVEVDKVQSYFGMRKIEARNGMIYLNNHPYIQKLLLDQGYWPDGLITAPSDEAFRKDICMAKAMGFNGCRKHQKCEDPRFLYWADKIGFLVWGEMAACPQFTADSAVRTMNEWASAVNRDYNHPSIVTWVALNESWGVPQIERDTMQQAFSLALYYEIKSLDKTRLVISNDGWEITKSDICTIHNYQHGHEQETSKQQAFRDNISTLKSILNMQPSGRKIYAGTYEYNGEPVMLTEFGGISLDTQGSDNWGYTYVQSGTQLEIVYQRLIEDIKASEVLFGYCYTQLADVQQETNGLLTEDRKYKVDPQIIKKINDGVCYMHPIVWE